MAMGVVTALGAPGCSGGPAVAPEHAPVCVPAPPASGNPFEGASFYVDPAYAAKVEATVREQPARAAQLRKVETLPTALWLDSVAAVPTVSRALDDAARQESGHENGGKGPVVTVVVLYDLPERDCSAQASSGELSIENGGEARYQHDVIEPLAAQFRAHASQRIVVVVEPNCLVMSP